MNEEEFEPEIFDSTGKWSMGVPQEEYDQLQDDSDRWAQVRNAVSLGTSPDEVVQLIKRLME